MQTLTEQLRDEHGSFADPLEAIRLVAEAVDERSLPGLPAQIDEIHRFVVTRFLPHARAEERVSAQDEVSRLAGKLQALRERLLYSYFGPAELRSLREVLDDLYALIELHVANEDALYLTMVDYPPPGLARQSGR